MDEPEMKDQPTFDSSDTILVVAEGGGDNTVQPRPAYIPRGWPPQARPSSSHPSSPDTPPATS